MTWTRRRFLTASGAAAVAAAWRAPARAQAPKPITVSHSVSTFVYGQHRGAREKKLFEGEGVAVPFTKVETLCETVMGFDLRLDLRVRPAPGGEGEEVFRGGGRRGAVLHRKTSSPSPPGAGRTRR